LKQALWTDFLDQVRRAGLADQQNDSDWVDAINAEEDKLEGECNDNLIYMERFMAAARRRRVEVSFHLAGNGDR
jgi:hypothetical protein